MDFLASGSGVAKESWKKRREADAQAWIQKLDVLGI